jgi:hypothetical protein
MWEKKARKIEHSCRLTVRQCTITLHFVSLCVVASVYTTRNKNGNSNVAYSRFSSAAASLGSRNKSEGWAKSCARRSVCFCTHSWADTTSGF